MCLLVMMAYTMYKYGREDLKANNGKSILHYNIVFVWICSALFATNIIEYSTRINMIYHKGIYQENKFK